VSRDDCRKDMRYLVTVADDFGRSSSVNLAVANAFDSGILTAASIMAGGDAFEEAVRIALERPGLSVGLHATLCDGRAVLPHSRIPGLTNREGWFGKSPVAAWLRYSRPGLREQMEMEMDAQFARIENAGIRPSHVDCHHHLHMHPVVLKALCREASRRGVRWVRMPREPLAVILGTRSAGRGIMPFLEWATFGALSPYNMRIIKRRRMSVAGRVYGLSRTGSIDEQYLLNILDQAAVGNAEIFFHPDAATAAGRRELAALTAPAVRQRLASLDISLTGYGVLSGGAELLWEGS
jgi:hopanoid biosynthesis associated protein HpnK